MNNRIKTLSIAALTILVLLGGCSSRRDANGSAALPAAGGITAAAVESVAEPMRPFFATGLGFLILGGAVMAFGGKASGGLLMGLGCATTAVGVLFVQFPWVVLPLLLIAGLVAGLAIWDRIRARRELILNRDALAATAQVIQNLPEGKAIKNGLAQLGQEIEERVRAAINPIKEQLRKDGKIQS